MKMKIIFLRHLTGALSMLFSLNLFAFTGEVEINGIWYHIMTKAQTAEVIHTQYYNNVTQEYYNHYSGDVIIPNEVEYDGVRCKVVSLHDQAFMNCKDLKSVILPNSITSIGQEAFRNCVNLEEIIIPDGVVSLETWAFQDCKSLTSISIPPSITEIGWDVFDDCLNLTNVYITSLEAWLKISFPDDSRMGCNPLSYASHLFINGEEVVDLVIPNSVAEIPDRAFRLFNGIKSVTIPSSVRRIGEAAFYECSELTSINIPNSVVELGPHAFTGCYNATSVTLPNHITSISFFCNLSNLKSIAIPNSVKEIGMWTLSDCYELTDVYCYATEVPTTDMTAFSNSYIEYATLHVPEESMEAYKKTEPWSSFGKIVGVSTGEPTTMICEKPCISYNNGKLLFNCATSGASCVANITDEDIKTHNGNEISLTATYNISVYATATGYEDSDVATATLCWIDTEPKSDDITGMVEKVKAYPVLIQSNGGTIIVQGVADKTKVEVYTINGVEAGNSIVIDGTATINTKLNSGEIAIIKIGDKSVKVVVK